MFANKFHARLSQAKDENFVAHFAGGEFSCFSSSRDAGASWKSDYYKYIKSKLIDVYMIKRSHPWLELIPSNGNEIRRLVSARLCVLQGTLRRDLLVTRSPTFAVIEVSGGNIVTLHNAVNFSLG